MWSRLPTKVVHRDWAVANLTLIGQGWLRALVKSFEFKLETIPNPSKKEKAKIKRANTVQ
jgi:hypothetical protein